MRPESLKRIRMGFTVYVFASAVLYADVFVAKLHQMAELALKPFSWYAMTCSGEQIDSVEPALQTEI